MKKNVFLLLPLLLISSCSLKNNYDYVNEEFDNGELFTLTKDEDMVVDGIEDNNYKNLEVIEIYEPEYDITFTTKTYFGKNGFYIFSKVLNDTTVFYNKYENVDPYRNDGIEIHLSVDTDIYFTKDNLMKNNKITENTIQIRTDVSNKVQTWVGNNQQTNNLYEWTQYFKPVLSAVNVDGRINKKDGARGYSVELFVPYSTFNLSSAPEKVSIMPAFNNANDDSYRKWFTMKGMSHNQPTSWMTITKDNGIIYPGKGYETPSLELLASEDDPKYKGQYAGILREVDDQNKNKVDRVSFKMFVGMDGIYTQFIIKDKEKSSYSDSIYSNDGVEFYIDTIREVQPSVYRTGIYRFLIDVDNGVQTDFSMDGLNNTYPVKIATSTKINIEEIEDDSIYSYKYKYVFEMFIPFESINLTYSSSLMVNSSFAYKSPNEASYMERIDPANLKREELFCVDGRWCWDPGAYWWVSKKGLM